MSYYLQVSPNPTYRVYADSEENIIGCFYDIYSLACRVFVASISIFWSWVLMELRYTRVVK